ncbi:ADP-ribosylglycohydrolase family protein [Nocardia salmonicida]|uniref:ADP-ribosylglycohydrolase family protein n=1 Tax=Nocardia salmonicida TaxID=53431 RepID=UPI0009FF4AA4|nr:ADP-ribosylglycohydrolase family protein [Nocardia salmonicida]MBC7299530.1 ADP-ribosylglycohydrolase family protein [Nocardia sp.]
MQTALTLPLSAVARGYTWLTQQLRGTAADRNPTSPLADRAAGALLGTAVGDALGAGYEFTHPTPRTKIDMVGGGVFKWAPGEWTDDTSMMVAVALAADEFGNLHDIQALNGVAAQFITWWDSKPRDIGRQTRQVLSARSKSAGQMWARAGKISGRKGGNGSLMRTAPIGLVYLDDAETCAAAAVLVSSLTHDDERAAEACTIWSLAIRHAVLHGNFDGVGDALSVVDANYWEPLLDQAETAECASAFPRNGWVVHALQTAWWAITHADTLPGALELAVRAGGDTDTTAAIAGALLGARYGASAVPARWRRIVHGYPGLCGDDLAALGVRLVHRQVRQPG